MKPIKRFGSDGYYDEKDVKATGNNSADFKTMKSISRRP